MVAGDRAFARSLAILIEDELRVEVRSPGSIPEALRLLAEDGAEVRLVLADTDVGYAALRELLAACSRPRRPVAVVVLAVGGSGPTPAPGVHAVLVKPLDPERLLRLIEPLLA